jgi:CubicO group peptidase (beta-lactamase class C family)
MFKRFAALAAAVSLTGCAIDMTPREPSASPAQAPPATSDLTPREHTPPETNPVLAKWNAAALAEAVAYVESQKTTGFLIIQDGETITEHNWPLPNDATSQTFRANFVHGASAGGALREDVASQQKALVALLVGIGVDRGKIDIERPVSDYIGSRWSKATPQQEGAIKVRNLLEMNSGLKEDFSFDAPAGTKFFYNTPAYAMLKPVLEKAADQDLRILTQLWLTKVINMHDTAWEQRPAVFADVGNPTGLVTTPRDLALMGQLILNGGKRDANGGQIISKEQLDAIFVRSSTNPAYGRLWWLNGSDETVNVGANSPRRAGQLIPSAPRDLVAALGAADRKLFIVPSSKLLVIRTGQAAPDRDFNDKLWQMLSKAMPQH